MHQTASNTLAMPARKDNVVASPRPADFLPWLIAGVGMLAMYVPSMVDLFNGIWRSEQQGHGPIVGAIAIWLIYRKWPDVMATPARPARFAGWLVFSTGILLYVAGRVLEVLVFEVGSLIWVLSGLVLLLRGVSALKSIWFALFFLLFMIPLPGFIVDAATQPMKMAVSYVAETLMYSAGYPVARSGVVLQIGQYQLLVADACAGLHTLFTLEAMGLLYLNLVRHESVARNITLAILIVPISFTANVIRVIVLTLITYYLGDEAGQGFLHGFAGMVLFIVALLLIIGVDSIIRSGIGWRIRRRPVEA